MTTYQTYRSARRISQRLVEGGSPAVKVGGKMGLWRMWRGRPHFFPVGHGDVPNPKAAKRAAARAEMSAFKKKQKANRPAARAEMKAFHAKVRAERAAKKAR